MATKKEKKVLRDLNKAYALIEESFLTLEDLFEVEAEGLSEILGDLHRETSRLEDLL